MFPVNGLSGTTDEELGPLGVLVAFASIFSGCGCLGMGLLGGGVSMCSL